MQPANRSALEPEYNYNERPAINGDHDKSQVPSAESEFIRPAKLL